MTKEQAKENIDSIMSAWKLARRQANMRAIKLTNCTADCHCSECCEHMVIAVVKMDPKLQEMLNNLHQIMSS